MWHLLKVQKLFTT